MPEKIRASRNRTLTLTDTEQQHYLSKCIPEPLLPENTPIQNATIFGDCLNTLPKLPPASVDLLIADPPYNMDKTFATSRFKKMDAADYTTFTRTWIEAALPTLKPNASIYICCDWQTSAIISNLIAEYFTIRNRITWQREKGRGSSTNWKNAHEDIWYATLSNQYTFNPTAIKQRRKVIAPYRTDGQPKDWVETPTGNYRDTHASNFWDDISIPYWSMPENTDHPTQKPEKLFAKLILASSNPGDLVLDPFAGVGTSSVAAKKLGRHYLAIEREPIYCALTEKRLELADADPTIQGYTDGVFWARNTFPDQKKSPTTL